MARSRNAELVSNELRRLGMSDLKVNALVGGFIQESGHNLNPTVSHDGGTGFGIAGYRDPEPGKGRWTNLRNFASANGWDVNDPVTQARFTAHELGYEDPVNGRMKGPGYNAEARASAMMRGATTLEGAARGAIAYERPQGFSWDNPQRGHGFGNRLANAQRLAGLPVTDTIAEPGRSVQGALAPDGRRVGPTVERAATIDPNLAAAQAMQPISQPAEPDLKLSDLTSVEGIGRVLGHSKTAEALKSIADKREASNQASEIPNIDPAVALASVGQDFGPRFAAASQLMSTLRRPQGILGALNVNR